MDLRNHQIFQSIEKSFERLITSEYYFPIFEEALAKQNVP
jgi:hypothetical protein